jgi:hypothetical protein
MPFRLSLDHLRSQFLYAVSNYIRVLSQLRCLPEPIYRLVFIGKGVTIHLSCHYEAGVAEGFCLFNHMKICIPCSPHMLNHDYFTPSAGWKFLSYPLFVPLRFFNSNPCP